MNVIDEIQNTNIKDFFIELDSKIDRKVITRLIFLWSLGLTVFYLAKILFSYTFFRKRGIKTPKFRLLFGNIFELYKHRNDTEVVHEWSKKYGKTFGYFEGRDPTLVTSDLEILQEVYIKQFHNFTARKKLPFDNENQTVPLIRATKSKWKRMRLIINPTFSTAKIREMGPLIVKCVDRLLNQLDTEIEQEINITDFLKLFTMDTIWNCAFGLDIDLQNNPNNEYFRKSESLFVSLRNMEIFQMFSLIFYELNPFLYPVLCAYEKFVAKYFPEKVKPISWLSNKVDYLIKRRIEEKINKRDYMQLLLEAHSSEFVSNHMDHLNLNETENSNLEKKLSDEEVKVNLVMFMLAGYETTSTALSYCSFVLATNQEEQDKLREEIDSHFKDTNTVPNTDNIKDLEYLDMFCKEVLRVYPIAKMSRRCVNATTIKGINIPEDLLIRPDVLGIHNDPDLWGPTDPNQFYPLRHSPEIKRSPFAFLGFGLGPRNCIGMKFALVEMKLALVNLLLKYEIHPTKNTPKKLEIIETIVRTPKDGIKLCFKKRNE